MPESDYRQAESQYQEAAGPGARARAPDRAAGELHQRAARPQSRPDSARTGHRRAAFPRGARRTAGIAAGAPARHPPGRGEPHRRQRRHRRGQGCVLSRHQPYRAARPGKRAALGSLQGPLESLVVRRGPAATDLQCRPDRQLRSRAPKRCSSRRSTRTRNRSSARSRTWTTRWSIGRSSDRYARSRRRTSWRCFASAIWPCCATREGATIYLEVANAEQSLFNAQLAVRRRRSPNSSSRTRICTRRWAAAGSRKRKNSFAAASREMKMANSTCQERAPAGR